MSRKRGPTYRIKRPEITIDELVRFIKDGAKVRKLPPFGLTVDEAGRVYAVGKYYMIVKGTEEEIGRRVKEARRAKR